MTIVFWGQGHKTRTRARSTFNRDKCDFSSPISFYSLDAQADGPLVTVGEVLL